MTCPLAPTRGEAASTAEHSLAIASQSSAVSVGSLASRTPPRSVLPGMTTMTLVPRPWSCPWTSAPALSPIETMVVTAAMPMTTPSTVRPARILFFARARRAMRRVRKNFIKGLLAGLDSGHQLLALADLAGNQFRVLTVAEPGYHLERAQVLAIHDPHVPAVSPSTHL